MGTDLIIGVDSFIGSYLAQCLLRAGRNVVGTYQRLPSALSQLELIELDITSPTIDQALTALTEVDRAFICVQHGTVLDCAEGPTRTRAVNVVAVKRLLETLGERSIKPIYLSTSMVFRGDRETFHTETDSPNPQTEYGYQKLEVERFIQSHFADYVIVRLTKVVANMCVPYPRDVFSTWQESLRRKQKIFAFTDLFIQPITLGDVVSFLEFLSQGKGIYHVSGTETGSYYDFALKLVTTLGLDRGLIRKEYNSNVKGSDQRHRYNYLSNSLAIKQASINPLPIESLWRK